ncbi:MAG: hypothetical protein P1U48_17035 [Pseudooceanicola sp.]|nr:hypothetical protein [Pseudooceanicola sp.]
MEDPRHRRKPARLPWFYDHSSKMKKTGNQMQNPKPNAPEPAQDSPQPNPPIQFRDWASI